MKSREELKAEANAKEEVAAEEEIELEEPETEEVEDDEEADDTEAESDGPLEELELEPDGELDASQHKPDPEEALLHKLSKKQRKLSKANSTIEELEAKIAALESAQRGGQQQQPQRTQEVPEPELPRVPMLYEEYKGKVLNTPDEYSRAYQDWMRDVDKVKQSTQQRRQASDQYRQDIEKKTLSLARRVSKFAVEHKMKDDYVVDAVQRATEEIDTAANQDGAFAYLLDAVGDGAEKAAIYVGSKDGELEKIKQLLAEDRTGLKAVTYLTRIATRKPASRRVSRAPEPDQPVKGDVASGNSAKKLQKQLDAADDIHKRREIRKKAKELGVKLI